MKHNTKCHNQNRGPACNWCGHLLVLDISNPPFPRPQHHHKPSLFMQVFCLLLVLVFPTSASTEHALHTDDNKLTATGDGDNIPHNPLPMCLKNLYRKPMPESSTATSGTTAGNKQKYSHTFKYPSSNFGCTPENVLDFVQSNGWEESEVLVTPSQKHMTSCDMYQGKNSTRMSHFTHTHTQIHTHSHNTFHDTTVVSCIILYYAVLCCVVLYCDTALHCLWSRLMFV